ncbi:MAG: diaminopimelate epimerase [Bacteroidota bacterium]
MEQINFYKYHGAGNDFIIINEFDMQMHLQTEVIHWFCDRHFGIGADGLIRILPSEEADFEMKYYNADGYLGSMCGNGGRCAALFTFQQGLAAKEMEFIASDGKHKAHVLSTGYIGEVLLQLSDVKTVEFQNDHYFIDTGSPHYISFRENLESLNLNTEAKPIRWSYRKNGTNVNFVEDKDGIYTIRTFERGVEAETLACGTGITAAAIAIAEKNNWQKAKVPLQAAGGILEVSLEKKGSIYTNIWLKGPAEKVFKGTTEIRT